MKTPKEETKEVQILCLNGELTLLDALGVQPKVNTSSIIVLDVPLSKEELRRLWDKLWFYWNLQCEDRLTYVGDFSYEDAPDLYMQMFQFAVQTGTIPLFMEVIHERSIRGIAGYLDWCNRTK